MNRSACLVLVSVLFSCGDSGASDGGTASGSEDGGSGSFDIGPCADLIECAQAAGVVSSGFIAAYGPEGECYQQPGVTEQDCWLDCEVLLEDLGMLHPDVVECVDGTTTGAESGAGCGVQPSEGAYSDCSDMMACDTGLVGASHPASGNCICVPTCQVSSDCPTTTCSAVPTCIQASATPPVSVCLLDCSMGEECPLGMECTDIEGDGSGGFRCY